MPAKQDPVARFWAKVNKTDGCWLWTRPPDSRGYGRFNPTHDRDVRAHRYSWTLAYGLIPDGVFVCHHCDVRLCVRPDHLFLGDQESNMADMAAKGRSTQGSRHPQSKLTEELVKQIRERAEAGESHKSIRLSLGVAKSTVSMIVSRTIWRHV